MKKWILFILFLGLSINDVHAEEPSDMEVYQAVYENLQSGYIQEQPATKTAVMVLKSISQADKKLLVADDDSRVTLYYNAKVAKSFLKPENQEDIDAAVKLTSRVIKAAQDISAKTKEKDFDLADIMLEHAINNGLDGDSKYYPQWGAEEKGQLKNRRHFASRMIENILYIKIGAFNKYTLENIQNAIKENTEAQAAILDLRGSPGGLFSQAIEIADAFLDEGIIASEHGRNGNKQKYYNAKEGDILNAKPLVVLTDGETMSSAEIVAAALQEQSRAKIIGTDTFGKGTRQNLVELPNGAELGYTAAYIYTPSEKKLNSKGVSPDICTFNMGEGRKLEDILNRTQPKVCGKENREKYELEIEIAKKLLKERI